jgi:hypothetical protein
MDRLTVAMLFELGLNILFFPEHGGIRFFQNAGNYLPDCTVTI